MIKNILIAEDDRVTAHLVKTQLEAKGYCVYTANNGIEAMKVFSLRPIDLLITDVIMPKMDGVDLYEAVKGDPKTSDIPIIIVTDKAVFKESFSSLGVSNFVEKTTDIKALLEKIETIKIEVGMAKKYSKILLSGSHRIVLEQMKNSLKGMQYLNVAAFTSEEIISKALSMKPHALVVDVMFQDQLSAPELIRALRCINILRQMKIITYASFPEDFGIDVESIQALEEAMKECAKAGADLYIGRFNQSFFLEKLVGLGI